jgi:hypothetical protein
MFILGAAFSVIRMRWNTTASMIVHGTYVALTLLGPNVLLSALFD